MGNIVIDTIYVNDIYTRRVHSEFTDNYNWQKGTDNAHTKRALFIQS